MAPTLPRGSRHPGLEPGPNGIGSRLGRAAGGAAMTGSFAPDQCHSDLTLSCSSSDNQPENQNPRPLRWAGFLMGVDWPGRFAEPPVDEYTRARRACFYALNTDPIPAPVRVFYLPVFVHLPVMGRAHGLFDTRRGIDANTGSIAKAKRRINLPSRRCRIRIRRKR